MPLFAQNNEVSPLVILGIVMGLILIVMMLVAFFVVANYFGLWIQARTTKAGITIWDLLGMSFRKVNPRIIVRSKIMAVQAGLNDDPEITTRAIEAHYLAGGNPLAVVRALIA